MARPVRHSPVRLAPLAAVVLALALPLAPTVVAATTSVDIAGFAFAPQTITVHVGDTVTWTNADAQRHTATADDGSFNTGAITSGQSKSVTLMSAGTFPYHCSIHTYMTATIVVESAPAPATDTAPVGAPDEGGLVLSALGVALVIGLEIGRRRFRAARS